MRRRGFLGWLSASLALPAAAQASSLAKPNWDKSAEWAADCSKPSGRPAPIVAGSPLSSRYFNAQFDSIWDEMERQAAENRKLVAEMKRAGILRG